MGKSKVDLYVIEKVRTMRLDRGMSQAILAAKLELSTSFIGDIESPHRVAKYSVDQINKLARLFECSPKDFLPEIPF